MAINMYATRVLLQTLQYIKKPCSYLLDTFTQKQKPTRGKYIDIDIVRGGQKMAAFVSPVTKGEHVKKDAFKTLSFQPGYTKEFMLFQAGDGDDDRTAGQTIYAGNDNAQSFEEQQLKDGLSKLLNRILVREEWMASQALLYGKYSMKGDNFPEVIVDFDPKSAHFITLATGNKWNANLTVGSVSSPIQFLRAHCNLIFKSGRKVVRITMDPKAAQLFLDHPDTKDYFSNQKNYNYGFVEPKPIGDDNAYFLCKLLDPAVEIYVYSGSYEDKDGNAVNFLPDYTVLFGNPNSRFERRYASIYDKKCMYPVDYFAKTYEEDNPSGVYLLVQSAPVLAFVEPDSFGRAFVA